MHWCVRAFLIDVHYASSQHKLQVKIKGKWGFSRTCLVRVGSRASQIRENTNAQLHTPRHI